MSQKKPHIGWRNELAQYHAARAVKRKLRALIDELQTGRWDWDQPDAARKQVLKKLRRLGLLKVRRSYDSSGRAHPFSNGRNAHQHLGPYVRPRPLAKSLKREKQGRHV